MKVESFSNYASINTTQSKAVSIPSLSLRCKQIACAILALAFTAEASDTRKTMTLETSQFSFQTLALSFLAATLGGLFLARCRTKSKETQVQPQLRSQPFFGIGQSEESEPVQKTTIDRESDERIRLVKSDSPDRFNAQKVFCRDNDGTFLPFKKLRKILAHYDSSELMAMLAFAARTEIQGQTLKDKYWQDKEALSKDDPSYEINQRIYDHKKSLNEAFFQASLNITVQNDCKALLMLTTISGYNLKDQWIEMMTRDRLFSIYVVLLSKISNLDLVDPTKNFSREEIAAIKSSIRVFLGKYGIVLEENEEGRLQISQAVVQTPPQSASTTGQSQSLIVAS